jgi:DNA mismatch repair protein PMS2
MFFVNSRPCALPQVAKAVNEVYKSYNITQSPFIFANLKLDTNSYDVNVSPDKRTILLHDQNALLEALKSSLTELFEAHEQSVPQAQLSNKTLPAYKSLTITRRSPEGDDRISRLATATTRNLTRSKDEEEEEECSSSDSDNPPPSMVRKFAARNTVTREDADRRSKRIQQAVTTMAPKDNLPPDESNRPLSTPLPAAVLPTSTPVRDFNARLGVRLGAEDMPVRQEDEDEDDSIDFEDSPTSAQENPPLNNRKATRNSQVGDETDEESDESTGDSSRKRSRREDPIPLTSPDQKVMVTGALPSAFQRMRKPRGTEDTATIIIGDTTTVTTLGTPPSKRARIDIANPSRSPSTRTNPILRKSLRGFVAPGSELQDIPMDDVELITIQTDQAESSNANATVPKLKQFPSAGTLSSSNLVQVEEDKQSEASEVVSLNDDPEGDNSSDEEYVDEAEKKVQEEAKVAKMIAVAEESAARPTEENVRRATSLLKTISRKDATLQLLKRQDASTSSITETLDSLQEGLKELDYLYDNIKSSRRKLTDEKSDEERLALSVSKADFSQMKVNGQFNLGFILATRPAELQKSQKNRPEKDRSTDELFIIDQHASDEKYNFERLQAETVVQNQRLVHPKSLDLTAVEEELILNNSEALSKNGFVVTVDQSGDKPVGRRAQLVSLPMSKEVVFDSYDLEELLALLADRAGSEVPRPSKVRRMFAMRACRSSIMVGKTLTVKQMQKVVRHMGKIDKPWNCPHGRPTMRHLFGLDSWQSWQEGSGLVGLDETAPQKADWNEFIRQVQSERESEAESEDMENAEDDG